MWLCVKLFLKIFYKDEIFFFKNSESRDLFLWENWTLEFFTRNFYFLQSQLGIFEFLFAAVRRLKSGQIFRIMITHVLRNLLEIFNKISKKFYIYEILLHKLYFLR